MATNPNFEALVAATPSSFAADFRLRPMPKLSDAMAKGGTLNQIFQAHDQAMEQWRQDAERSVNERITQPNNQPLGKTAASTSTPTTSPSATDTTQGVTGVTSVNGKQGEVELTTDDVPSTATKPYMTETGWLSLFDHDGFARNIIPATDTVHVPPNRNGVIAGGLTIEGVLKVDGTLVIL